ncbi:MAG: TetR/AcrR family transcriptional regulator [Rectinemataceae bacterium]
MNKTRAADAGPDTKTRILESAAAVFARKGYHDTRMDDIVAESGASKGGIYFHWPSKEKVFLALIDSFAALLEERLKERLSAAPGGMARLDEALAVCVETFGRYKPLAKVAFVQASGLGMAFERKRQAIGDRFIAIIKENLETAAMEGSIPPLDAELAAHVWMGALNEVIMRWIQTGSPDAAASLPALRTILLRSVGVADGRLRT